MDRICSARHLLALVVTVLAQACATCGPPPAPTPPLVSTEIVVVPRPGANRGAVLHLMLTRVDPKSPPVSYDAEAARCAAYPHDDSVLATKVVLPGYLVRIPIKVPSDQAVAAAFFFTEPGADWRVALPQPLPPRITIELGADGIERMEPPGGR